MDHTARFLDYSPEVKLLVVDQGNVQYDMDGPYTTGCQVIRVFAKALYHVTGTRPVDPNWDSRRLNVQQYELRVRRMDIRFDEKLRELYDNSMNKGLWKGTAAAGNHVEYWAEGVLAYFDAAGEVVPPNDSGHQIATRETLKEYDPGLFALVEETMAYKGKVDWRYRK
jgi:alpha-glucosidase